MKKLFILIIAAMVAAGVSAAEGDAGEKKELRANFRHKIGVGVGVGVLTGRSTTDLTRYSFPSGSKTPVGESTNMDYCLMVNDNWGIGVDASGTFISGDCEYPESDQDRYEYYSNDNQRKWDVSGLTVGPVYRIIKGPWAVMFQMGFGATFYEPRAMSKEYVREHVEYNDKQGVIIHWRKSTCFAIMPKVSVMRQMSRIFGLTASIGYRQSFGDIEGQYTRITERGETLQSFRQKNFGGNSLMVQVGFCFTFGKTLPR